jgi:hypothetical protein
MPVAIDRAKRVPKNEIAHYGELKPIILTEVYSGNW